MRVKYKKNPHQKLFQEDDLTKFLHLSSCFGGGKSYALIMKLLKLSYLNRPYPGGLVCQSIADYKKDILPLFEMILEENNLQNAVKYHKTDKWFKFPWTKGKLYVASAEKAIRGPNWGYAGINEATLIPHVRYKEVVGRVRIKGAPFPQIASSGTPEGLDTWAYENFIENPMKNSRIIFGRTKDNLDNLSPDYVESLENSYDAVMLKAFLDGQFVNMNSNSFYYTFSRDRNVSKEAEYMEGQKIIVTIDFNVDPMTCAFWHMGKKPQWTKDFSYCFDEIVIENGADTNLIAKRIKERFHPDDCIIYPDPSGKNRSTKGPPDIEILRQHGFGDIRFKSVAPGFRERQLAMCNLFEKRVIVINPRCEKMIKDFEAVSQNPLNYEKIKTNPKLTHLSDGADYYHDIEWPLSGKHSKVYSMKYR